ncbi:MAG: hypothetical protein O7E52_06940 [Candidatus Poribacteria bacterium]|nr:hypothetical protein [Candidatus Poribacteria bacterium]
MFTNIGSSVALIAQTVTDPKPSVIDIGSRLELFVDDYLIDRLNGARLVLRTPQPAEVVLKFDRPWEGGNSAYFTVIKAGLIYRMYYRGSRVEPGTAQFTCYAESLDGIGWKRPNLGLFEVEGTWDNNVILTPEVAPVTHNFCPFIDKNPDAPPSERFKAVGGGGSGLYPFVSADGIRWRKLIDDPIITKGAFDSQNVPFWSESEGCYVCYFRIFAEGVRSIAKTTSADFLNWSVPVPMRFGDTPREHLYTNTTHPYFRAPHIYIAIPRRFMPGRQVLTDAQVQEMDLANPQNYSGLKDDCSDGVFMTSRGGYEYDRTFLESFIRPGLDLRNWTSRSNDPGLGVVPTGPTEMSLYVKRHKGQATAHLQRLTLRTDGFVSVNAPYRGGEMVTKPLVFAGKELIINYATSAAGSVRVEILDVAGKPIDGYGKHEGIEILGDQIERVVSWQRGSDVSRLAGTAIRLRFVMKDADLYSLCFQ